MVSNILKNEIYTGTLITHKKKSINIRGKVVKLPEEEHFRLKTIMKQLFQ